MHARAREVLRSLACCQESGGVFVGQDSDWGKVSSVAHLYAGWAASHQPVCGSNSSCGSRFPHSKGLPWSSYSHARAQASRYQPCSHLLPAAAALDDSLCSADKE